MSQPLLTIVGATATGKSELALQLATELGGELVNADALQVYRGFDIGTAKPTPEERRAVPHHLVDVLDPDQPYSAGEFARRARRAIREIAGRGRLPIVVGGSGLYQRALLQGLSPIPPVGSSVRRALAERLATEGLPSLYAELERRDPEGAAKLSPQDRQRILRGLEILEATGRPAGSWHREQLAEKGRYRALRIGLTLARTILYDRIEARVERMVEQGWLAEVGRLVLQYRSTDIPAFQAIGYRQLVRHIRAEIPLREALEATKRATRKYAKRQETWFRKESGIVWLDGQDTERRLPNGLHNLIDGLDFDGFRGGS